MARVFYEVPLSNAAAAPKTPVTVDAIVRQARSVPVAPEVLPKLQAKLLDVDTDVSDLAALIRLDSGLASSVLRVSNSAYYARGSTVSSIEEAVTLIGYQETLRLVARCSFATVMKGELACYGISGEQLWEEAVLSAFAMEQLSQITMLEVSEGYVTGLLHAMGMVAINDHLQRAGVPARRAASAQLADIVQWESDVFGFHHGDVGAAMMRQWHFPVRVVHAVERQYEAKPRPDEGVLTSLLPLAQTIATHLRLTVDQAEAATPVFDPVRVDHAGLDRPQLVEVIEAVRAEWAQTRQFLR